jgi:hypothetical protein
MSPRKSVTVTLTLEPAAAAALHRLCEKVTHSDCMQYLYPHLPRELRSDQAYEMVAASSKVHTALSEAGVSSWPWIETGEVQS